MNKVIKKLEEELKEVEKTFIINSLVKRSCKHNENCPDVDADLDYISELHEAIYVLKSSEMDIH
jgi:hypothetical protein